jgi:hypothetical protein
MADGLEVGWGLMTIGLPRAILHFETAMLVAVQTFLHVKPILRRRTSASSAAEAVKCQIIN